MFFDEIRTLRTINDAPNDFTVKFFIYLALNQPHDGITGYQIEKLQLQFDLKLSKTNFFNALRWLKENLVVNELKLDDKSDFMLNPYIVMNNSDRNARIAEWNRRCDLFIQRKNRLRKQKRLRELRNAKKQ